MAQPTGYLLDTNILVALVRANELGQAIDLQFGLRSSMHHSMICVVTVGEMLSLVRQFGWAQAKRNALQDLLNDVVWVDINSPQILDAYGEIDHFSSASGLKMGKNDVWIAAAANVTKVPLLTTDHDFDHLDGKYINVIWIDPQLIDLPT